MYDIKNKSIKLRVVFWCGPIGLLLKLEMGKRKARELKLILNVYSFGKFYLYFNFLPENQLSHLLKVSDQAQYNIFWLNEIFANYI